MNFLPAFPTQQKTCAHQTAHFYSVMMTKLKIEFIRRHQFSFGLFTWSVLWNWPVKGSAKVKVRGRAHEKPLPSQILTHQPLIPQFFRRVKYPNLILIKEMIFHTIIHEQKLMDHNLWSMTHGPWVRFSGRKIEKGYNKPIGCIARQRTAVIIPYRNREDQLKMLLGSFHFRWFNIALLRYEFDDSSWSQ